jgi:hypothetical protein
VRLLVFVLTLVGFSSAAFCQTMVVGTITLVRTGWNADSFAVVTREPILNPAHCPEPDGYLSDSTQPGYNTCYAAALTAYIANHPLTVTIDNTHCAGTRPKLIGINLMR